jgi:hypothetical protein
MSAPELCFCSSWFVVAKLEAEEITSGWIEDPQNKPGKGGDCVTKT